MNVNISWFNILVLKLFSKKNGLMAKLYNTLIMLKIVFMHVHCIRLCMLETYCYNNVSHTMELFIYFNKINKYILDWRQRGNILVQFLFDLTLFSKIHTCITYNDVTYIIMPRIAQESSKYLFPLWSFHNKIAD